MRWFGKIAKRLDSSIASVFSQVPLFSTYPLVLLCDVVFPLLCVSFQKATKGEPKFKKCGIYSEL